MSISFFNNSKFFLTSLLLIISLDAKSEEENVSITNSYKSPKIQKLCGSAIDFLFLNKYSLLIKFLNEYLVIILC